MSFIKDKNTLLKKYPEYRVFANIDRMKKIWILFCELLLDHFNQETYVEVNTTSLKQIAQNMEICCGGKISAYNIQQRLDDKFEIVDIDYPMKGKCKIKRKFEKGSFQPYIKSEYWDMKMNMEFCISAGMSYKDAKYFTSKMMGMTWLYLRNIEHLLPDFCLRFSLGPIYYQKLYNKIEEETKLPDEPTKNTTYFVAAYSEFCKATEEVLEEENLSEEELCEEFLDMMDTYKEYLYGDFKRAMNEIYELIYDPKEKYRKWCHTPKYLVRSIVKKTQGEEEVNLYKIKKSTLANALSNTMLPWESKREMKSVEKETENIEKKVTLKQLFLNEVDKERVCRERIDV